MLSIFLCEAGAEPFSSVSHTEQFVADMSNIEDEPRVTAEERAAIATNPRLLALQSDTALQATWRAAVRENLVDSVTDTERKMLLNNGQYPERCIETKILSQSTTTKRGKSPRAYPRKGIVKLPTDKKASKIKVGLHQLAAYHRWGKPRDGDEASHYWCDNHLCVNPGHLCYESTDVNSSRLCCKVFHNDDTINYRCPHTPTCRGCHPYVKIA